RAKKNWVINGQADPCAFNAESYMYIGWALTGRPGEDYLLPDIDPNGNVPTTIPDIFRVLDSGFLLYINGLLTAQAGVSPVGSQNLYDTDVKYKNAAQKDITLYQLREGVERFLITDINNPGATALAQSSIPIELDLTSTRAEEFSHVPGGGNVLFLDGHVQFIKYPSDFPVTKAFAVMTSLF
ncbi:MAG: hypothetical protein NTU83_08105, partial [Candidatus Hydrogenedentes bacterium]|nr:hypothetical protein [Candidatus Hydrogenedentota bacterium]